MAMVRDPKWYERHRVPLTTDGTMPFARYVVRAKGRVDIGNVSCAMCHTRVMPDGTAVLGAQGNFPFESVTATTHRRCAAAGAGVPLQRRSPARRGIVEATSRVKGDDAGAQFQQAAARPFRPA